MEISSLVSEKNGNKQTYIQTNKQMIKNGNKHTDRQTNRHTKIGFTEIKGLVHLWDQYPACVKISWRYVH